jgi:hypothetical protein
MKYVYNTMPSDLLKQLLRDAPAQHKDSDLITLMIDSRMRERSSILGSMYGLFAAVAEKDDLYI